MFSHLSKPFLPGMVVPSNRDPNGWHFTFQDSTGQDYYHRVVDFNSAAKAKQAMREFVKSQNNRS